MGHEIPQAARELLRAAVERGLSLGTAESLTGGAVAEAIVRIPGASAALQGGVVSYSHAVKTAVLGVPAELLARTGAVDREVALAMARGARVVLGADLAVATTGAAGPEPHDGQPVGTVWIAVVGPGGEQAERLRLPGGREGIRAGAVLAALRLARRALEQG